MRNAPVACPICTKSSSELVCRPNRADSADAIDLSILKCRNCGHVFLGDYGQDYSQDLYSYYRSYQGKSADELYDPLNERSYLDVLDLITRHSCSSAKILDVGCGKGDFVYAARKHGYDVRGIDLALPAVEICQKFDLPVHALDFFSDVIEVESFDAITMFEVLEHLSAPVEFIQRAESVLKPGGVLYLTMPNYHSLDRFVLKHEWRVFHREHISYFTPGVLSSLVRNSTSFEILVLRTRNLSPELVGKLLSPFRSEAANGSTISKEKPDTDNCLDVRASISRSKSLSRLKLIANMALGFTGTGSTIIALLQRPY